MQDVDLLALVFFAHLIVIESQSLVSLYRSSLVREGLAGGEYRGSPLAADGFRVGSGVSSIFDIRSLNLFFLDAQFLKTKPGTFRLFWVDWLEVPGATLR